ncbi:MAG: M1 family metallopeptidase [Ignavibacteria bacterium]|nr:M1 family metallopeptidase [Ignavibacteria bacterium]
MKKNNLLSSIIFSLIFFILVSSLYSQTKIQIPRNVHEAYKKGTRSFDGSPGPNYWQNYSDYSIQVNFIPSERKIIGSEKIVYYNNSPDTLKRIVIRLLQDYFKKGSAREFQVNPYDIHDGTKINKLIINGNSYDLNDRTKATQFSTNLNLRLDSTDFISPKSKTQLEIDWEVTLPKFSNIRMGTYDTTSFFVAYWYPQIAVYDDVYGWDEIPYTGTVEQYNDFNNYNVKITVPKNFVVWATGILQNPEEVFSEKVLERFRLAKKSDTVVQIITLDDVVQNRLKTKDKDFLTYHYKAEYVPDFAFALSDHYLWDASTIVVDSFSGRKTFISAAYKKESKDFYDVAKIGREVLSFFSFEFPKIPYPYPSITVFNGQGGMEFPMMVNNGSTPSYSAALGLAAHEIAHTYFPFFMGINEKRFAWMDEGFAVMLPYDLQDRYSDEIGPRERNSRAYENFAGNEEEVPPIIPSFLLKGQSYRNASYARPGIAYDILRDMLGKEKFIEVMKEYVRLWNGKHPLPNDFFFTFNKYAGENLDWFFIPWFFEKGVPDLDIENVKLKKNELSFDIVKVGALPVPISIKITFEDKSTKEFYETAKVWKDGKNKISFKLKLDKKPISIDLNSSKIPDANRTKNEYYFVK